jgi:hypothetical protein
LDLEHRIYLTALFSGRDTEVNPEVLTPKIWEQIVSMAEQHGLAPQLYDRLEAIRRISALPDDLGQRLRTRYIGGVARGMQLSSELASLLEHFNKRGISVIVLKGPYLAEMVYRDWALRPMADFDLMVKKDDLARAVRALKESGYEASAEFNIDAQIKIHHDLPTLRKQDRFLIELHWTLELPTGAIKVDVDEVWRRARKTTIAGQDTLVLSDEDFLLHLCVHAAYHHRFSHGLLPLRDIAETIKSLEGRIDWCKLEKISGLWGADRCLFMSLYFVKELFGLDLPPEVRKRNLLDDVDSRVIEIARERIYRRACDSLLMTRNISRLWGMSGLREKAKFFLANAFPPPVVLATMYPANPSSKRIYLYYPVRLRDLLARYARTVYSLFRCDAYAVEQVRREEQGNILGDWLVSK